MEFKVDVDTVIEQCDKKLATLKRKSDVMRVQDIQEMTMKAKGMVCIYCELNENDFKLLFMEST